MNATVENNNSLPGLWYDANVVTRHSARSIEHDWTFVDIAPHVRKKLVAMGVVTMRDLTRMTEGDLLKIRGIGPRVLADMKQNLADLGLSLKGNRPRLSPPEPKPQPRAPRAFTTTGNVIRPAAWNR
jgi:DNA-directed RNA polymerase alpha subunit